ncbi:hypothetical protein WA026_018217 [Henosepilachna vigintioctopunctata]|uniref:Uncharacterized protein n=1 Tax=Henosepilachna vigintioctopunctata TaxID=420089 RepID=A0AAW1VBG7_9CUCU
MKYLLLIIIFFPAGILSMIITKLEMNFRVLMYCLDIIRFEGNISWDGLKACAHEERQKWGMYGWNRT